MLMRRLGRTGLKVSVLCLGGNVFSWTCDEKTSFLVLDAFLDGGGNFIDTADVYGRWVPGQKGGESEEIIGRWLRERRDRDRIVIGTKVSSPMGDGPNDRGLSRQHIMAAVEASLRRLQTSYIDLYQAHFDDPDTPMDETMRAFDDLVRQGKVRYVGTSNYSAWRLACALWASDRAGCIRFESLQPEYNLLDREGYERDLEPLCREHQVGVITYGSVARGFLTGKYQRGKTVPSTPRAARIQKIYMNERGWAILAEVERIAAEHRARPAQVALAWIIQRPGITAPIAGANSVEQVRELLGAADVKLSAEDVAALDKVSAWRADQ